MIDLKETHSSILWRVWTANTHHTHILKRFNRAREREQAGRRNKQGFHWDGFKMWSKEICGQNFIIVKSQLSQCLNTPLECISPLYMHNLRRNYVFSDHFRVFH